MVVAVLLGVLICYDVAGYFTTARQAELAAAHIVRPAQAEFVAAADSLAPASSAAQTLKKRNLFVLPAPRQNPVKEVAGILGDEALIGGRWFRAGDRVGDAEVLAVEPTSVRIRWDGREQDFGPIVADNRAGGTENAPAAGAGGRGGLTAEELARRREAIGAASPQDRQRLRQEMRERLASGG